MVIVRCYSDKSICTFLIGNACWPTSSAALTADNPGNFTGKVSTSRPRTVGNCENALPHIPSSFHSFDHWLTASGIFCPVLNSQYKVPIVAVQMRRLLKHGLRRYGPNESKTSPMSAIFMLFQHQINQFVSASNTFRCTFPHRPAKARHIDHPVRPRRGTEPV